MTRIDNLVAVRNWHELAEAVACQADKQTNVIGSLFLRSQHGTPALTILTTEFSLAYFAIKRSESGLKKE